MTREELEDGFWRAQRQFYSLGSIARRLLLPPNRHTVQSLIPEPLLPLGRQPRHPPADLLLNRSDKSGIPPRSMGR